MNSMLRKILGPGLSVILFAAAIWLLHGELKTHHLVDILKAYLPQQLSPEELEELARQAIEEVGATSMREMGQVMKVLVPRLQGRATGQQASQAVRKLLA